MPKKEELRELSEEFRQTQITNTRHSAFFFRKYCADERSCDGALGKRSGAVAPEKRTAVGIKRAWLFSLTQECIRPNGTLNNAWHSSMMGFRGQS